MDLNKTVRIILPVVKEEWCIKKYLAEAIESVAAQTYPLANVQLTIAWDGWTPVAALGFYLSCKGVKKIHVHHQITQEPDGVCTARNLCILSTEFDTPDYLVYLDADNRMEPTFIETMVGAISNLDDGTLVYCLQEMHVHDESGDLVNKFFRGEPKHGKGQAAFQNLFYAGNWIDMGTIIYPYRSDILFDTMLTRMVDWDLLLALGLEYKFYYIDDVLSIYNRNVNPNGISNREPFDSNYTAIKDKWRDAYNA